MFTAGVCTAPREVGATTAWHRITTDDCGRANSHEDRPRPGRRPCGLAVPSSGTCANLGTRDSWRVRLEAQDAALSRRRSRVRIPHALPPTLCRPRLNRLPLHGTIVYVTNRITDAQHLDDLAQLRRVRDRIDREYAQPLDVEALARGANMSAGHLSRQFHLAYGEPPYSYLMTRRIERAMALLRQGATVTEACFMVGCSSLGTFSTRFTELVGVPPSVYQRQVEDSVAGLPPCVTKQADRPVRKRNAPAPSAR